MRENSSKQNAATDFQTPLSEEIFGGKIAFDQFIDQTEKNTQVKRIFTFI